MVDDTQPVTLVYILVVTVLQELILAVPPFKAANQGPELSPSDFEELRAFVDFFSLMTYDASSPARPGPNAPWKWVKSNVQAVMSLSSHRRVGPPCTDDLLEQCFITGC